VLIFLIFRAEIKNDYTENVGEFFDKYLQIKEINKSPNWRHKSSCLEKDGGERKKIINPRTYQIDDGIIINLQYNLHNKNKAPLIGNCRLHRFLWNLPNRLDFSHPKGK
jgi:hypothetical protein